jgi:LuxR family maltose regulon positive regulatory protein
VNTPSSPLLQTKLHRPPVIAETVHRKRLHEVMDRALGLPLTLVSAPAGYGKSTLVSDWAETLDKPCAWLSLDSGDSDLKVFVCYVLAAIETVVPDACPETSALAMSNNPVPVPVLGGSLVNELDALDSPLVLVLDDYHRIDPASSVHEFLWFLLEHPPPALRLVLATRSDPTFSTGSLRGRGGLTEVRLRDLRFTASETSEYLERTSGVKASEEALANLAQQTEGWIVALRLVSIYLRHADDPEALLKRLHGGIRHTREYLLEEVLDQLPVRTRDCMLKTSILDRFCPELCDAVAAPTAGPEEPAYDGFQFIQELRTGNFFTIPLDLEGRWFRYHHLFQEMLRDQLQARTPPGEIAALHLLASAWFEGEGLIEEALKHALTAEDIDRVVQIVARHRHPTLNADNWHILESWMSLVPETAVQQHTELLITRAWILMFHYAFEALFPLLDQLEAMLVDSPAHDSIRAEIALCRGYGLFFMGEGVESLKLITTALERIPTACYEVRAQGEIIFALASQLAGKREQAVRTLGELLTHYDSPEELRKTRLLIAYVYIHLIDADLVEADRANRRFREVVERGGYAYVRAWADYLQGLIHLQRGEWDAAAEYLGRSVAQRFIHHKRAATDSMAGLMLAHQAAGREDEARSTCEVLRDYVGSLDDPTLWPLASSAESRLSIMQGRPRPANGRSDSSTPPAEAVMLWWLDLSLVTHCRALIAEGSRDGLAEAEAQLLGLVEMSEAQNNRFQLISILTLLAMVFEKQARTDEALTVLERALTLAHPGGLVFPFLELGTPMTALLEKVPRDTATGPFIEQIMAAAAPVGSPAGNGPRRVGRPPADLLTDREAEILELLARRLQYKQIAARLFISPQTVNSHLKNVYQKLGVSNRRQAVTRAAELGLLPPD